MQGSAKYIIEVMFAWDLNLATCSSLDGGLCRHRLDAAASECLCNAIFLRSLRNPTQHSAKWLFHPQVRLFIKVCGLAHCLPGQISGPPHPAEASRQLLRFLILMWSSSCLLMKGHVQPLALGVCWTENWKATHLPAEWLPRIFSLVESWRLLP